MTRAIDFLMWLLEPSGRITRRPYFLAGLGLVALKLLLDALLCSWLLDYSWSPRFYWVSLDWDAMWTGQPGSVFVFAFVAIPFAWAGAALSARRLRDAGVTPWFVLVFVMPFANIVLFTLLSSLPSAPPSESPSVPPNERGSGATSEPAATNFARTGPWPAIAGAAITSVLVWFGAVLLGFYGAALFLGAPFLQGLIVGLLAGSGGFGRAANQFLGSALISTGFLLLGGIEGIVCIVMASPLWLSLGFLGTAIGRAIHRNRPRYVMPAILVVPLGEWLEPKLRPEPTELSVVTAVMVDAPPATVWRHLVEFPELPPPTELVFRCGIAYPVRATIEGTGPGAVRRCSFSTGDFVEPIEVWDEPRLLSFSVDECPQPMVEWNPFHDHVDAAHLHSSFRAKRGQFELFANPDGTTRLVGTTWYSNGLWPEAYWSWWSDLLVHKIHLRVLEHIRSCSEADR